MGSVIFVVMLVLFFIFFFSLLAMAEGRGRTTKRREPSKRPVPAASVATVAMQRAGYEENNKYVQVTDIGLLAYRNTDDPKLIRYGDVLSDTNYLRPFVELWLPHQARGPVRFELVDSQNRLRYADEKRYDLIRGSNTLLPDTWLPLRGKAIQPDDWRLRVLAGNTLLAVHQFGWQPVGGGEIQRLAQSDGEISPALDDLLGTKPREAVSLSDLLADQED